MKIQLGFLSLLVVALWRSSHAELENFMLLAGPQEDDVFGCRSILPQQSREYFSSLQHRGVSHFTVALSWPRILPTGDPEHPHTQTLTCYKTLVRQLTHLGIKPLLVLHRSTVPEPFRSRYGTWENPKLVRLFEQYAEFVLAEFGDHVDTFITFSHVHELHETELQNTLQAHADVYKLYHGLLKEINLSLAIRANDVSSIFLKREDLKENMDFLSVHLVYNCGMKTDLTKELRKLKISSSQQSILIYQLTLNDCEQQEDNFQPLISLLHVLQEKELQIRGCDITQLFGEQVEEERPQRLQSESSQPKPNQRSASAFSYQKVWEKFKDESQSERDRFLSGSFPEAFQWSVSSESFQVEGGWAEHGKGETIWDRFSHDGQVYSNQTTDLACDSFHKVNYDTYLLRGMFLSKYQFSISWARIFPSGRKDSLVEKGAMYYDQMINTLQRSGIEPTVTLHHWDLPQALQEQGGWTNVSIVEAFKEFSDFCFSRYGDRVKTWITFGSPGDVSHFGYGTGEHPPSIKDPVVASYEVTHNILKSHAEAWHVYDEKYRKLQGGKVGIALHSEWAEPKNPSSARDIAAAERYLNFMLGWFAHPIFVDGDYPAVLRDQIETKKAECGRELARLPVFTEAEKQRIKGTADFFGLNHHTSRLISESLNSCEVGPSNVGDFQASIDPLWPSTASEKIQSVPWGLRRLLNYISLEYTSITKVPIYITGNGMPTDYNIGLIDDTQRVDYLKTYINEAMKAVLLDKVALQRFTVKALMDGFEGPQGYSHRFGLHYVDFNDPDRPRTPKESAHFYSNVIQRNGFPSVNLRKQIEGNKMKSVKRPHLPSSEVPSKSKIVWEKFSSQTKFERKLYHYGTFPVNFQWGVSSSAYQVEGGWNADGKGPSVWDVFAQKPGNIPNDDNGNIACDSYKKVEEDLYMLRALKVKIYKFSFSWSRIFPNGHKSSLNQKGVDYYNRLIDGLIANNITPIVTLYHLDLPQVLQETNGWENPDMIGIFNEYCNFCYETFGDRVKFWITINEPHTIAWLGYGLGQIPPNVKKPGDAPYRVAHNLIKAHARAYHTYDEKYRATQGGLVSISLNTEWAEPLDISVPREIEAADRALQFQIGWFAHPIFKNGDYPDAMKWHVGNKSELQGLRESRLPSFTDEEKSYIQGTADVFCINTYTTKVVQHVTSRLNVESYQNDMDVEKSEADGSETTAVKEQKAFAWGLRRLLSWLKEEYGDPEIYITESGEATGPAVTVDDTDRIFYLKTYVNEVLKAHNLDGVQVKGYAVSSLMDSFEWLNGYKVGYGLHHVNFKNPSRPRTPKRSAQMYFEIIKDNGFPMPEEERMMHGHFREGFVWSTATAAYQIEGAWRADGKGLSIWDTFAHTALKISNDENGDLACDSYHRFREDVENLKMLRVNHYRFSISWPRIMPDGTNRSINEAGLNYYHELVDALLAANIKPQVTLYHWDLPQALQDVGGWENHTVVDRFRDYADVLFNSLGDKVKFWITINEPYNVAMVGHGYGSAAPGISFRPGTAPYIVAHNLIKAHAEAWHLYNDKYRAKQGGIVGITINSDWAEPRNPYKQEDVDAARRVVQFQLGWFAHPIFKGDYSNLMKNIVRERSLAAGRPVSRLPEFSPAEVARIKGTHDYFGFNHYTTVLAYNFDYKDLQHYDADRGAGTVADRSWLDSGSFWLKVTPPGFRKILKFIKEEYGDPPVYITENGISERGPVNLNDVQRIHYYENYVNQALKAHLLDGVDIRGYAAWTLMDNLEWATGYDERFGLFYVNRSDPSLTRIPKKSVWYYATLANCNGFINPAEGPHDCQVFQPEDDGNTGTTSSPAPDEEDVSIHFLGLDISGPDAELALNLLFSLSVIAAVVLVLMGYGLFRTKKAAKRSRF